MPGLTETDTAGHNVPTCRQRAGPLQRGVMNGQLWRMPDIGGDAERTELRRVPVAVVGLPICCCLALPWLCTFRLDGTVDRRLPETHMWKC